MALCSTLVVALLMLTTAAATEEDGCTSYDCFRRNNSQLSEEASLIQIKSNHQDAYNPSFACYDQAVTKAYDSKLPVPVLERLKRLEVAMQNEGCLTQLLDMIPPPPRPRGQTPDAPIGPPEFLEMLWKRREQTPRLLQVQPVGITADPQAILDLIHACEEYDDFDGEEDTEYYHDKQTWSFCTVLSTDDDEDDTDADESGDTAEMPHLRESALGQLLGPLLDAGVLSTIEFSKVGPQSLVEWHADQIFDLVNADGLNCSASASDAFAMQPNPWQEGDLESVRLHIPLSNQGTTHFFTSGSALTMKAGDLVALDFYQPHSLYNFGTEARVNLLIDFDLTALHDELTMRKLLSSQIGQQVLGTIFRLGYHDPDLNQARQDLEKLLYEHQRQQCHGLTGFLNHEDDFHRLMQERKWVPLLEGASLIPKRRVRAKLRNKT